MEDFNFPPFFVDCLQSFSITLKITAYQIENALTAVFVCKDLPEQQDGEIHACNPAFDGLFF